MIEIIKPGHKKFKATCDRCSCEFTYTQNDVDMCDGNCCPLICCPECGKYYIMHKPENVID